MKYLGPTVLCRDWGLISFQFQFCTDIESEWILIVVNSDAFSLKRVMVSVNLNHQKNILYRFVIWFVHLFFFPTVLNSPDVPVAFSIFIASNPGHRPSGTPSRKARETAKTATGEPRMIRQWPGPCEAK